MPESGILLEICAASTADIALAQQSGADRIELNSALELGGLTPSAGLLAGARAVARVPVIAMCRPRTSGFCYTDTEFNTLLADVDACVAAGVAGVAFGVLTGQSEVDTHRCREVVRRCDGREAVFHRAFDLVPDPATAIQALIDCGVDRVMTSGGQATAVEGRSIIASLQRQFGDRIEILAAGGIRPANLGELLATGVRQIHAGPCQATVDPSQPADAPVRFDQLAVGQPSTYRVVCGPTVRELARLGRVKP